MKRLIAILGFSVVGSVVIAQVLDPAQQGVVDKFVSIYGAVFAVVVFGVTELAKRWAWLANLASPKLISAIVSGLAGAVAVFISGVPLPNVLGWIGIVITLYNFIKGSIGFIQTQKAKPKIQVTPEQTAAKGAKIKG